MPRALIVALALAGIGCESGRPWTVRVPSETGQVYLFARQGGCEGSEGWSAWVDPDSMEGARPEELEGVWGIGGFAYDEGCNLLGCGCLEVPFPTEVEVVTNLTSADDCPGGEPPAMMCGSDAGPPVDAGPDGGDLDGGPPVDGGGICDIAPSCPLPPRSRGIAPPCDDALEVEFMSACYPRAAGWSLAAIECPDFEGVMTMQVGCGSPLEDVRDMVASAGATPGGAIVSLGSCNYTARNVSSHVVFDADNPVVLEGEGPGATVLEGVTCTMGCDALIQIHGAGGVLLRDLRVDTRQGVQQEGIEVSPAGAAPRFVTLDGVEIAANGTGILIVDAEDVTIRRSAIDSGRSSIEAVPGTVAGGAQRLAVLSTSLRGIGDGEWGLNLHGVTDAEIAGVEVTGHTNGWARINGAERVWVHHGRSQSSASAVIADCTRVPCERQHRSVAIFDMVIDGAAAPAVSFSGVGPLWWLDNNQADGGAPLISGPSTVYVCQGSPLGAMTGFTEIDCSFCPAAVFDIEL